MPSMLKVPVLVASAPVRWTVSHFSPVRVTTPPPSERLPILTTAWASRVPALAMPAHVSAVPPESS